MTAPIKVFLTEAFLPLVTEIRLYGAIYQAEANARFGPELVDAALRRRVCGVMETDYGAVLHLRYKGRQMAGLAGDFKPLQENVENAVCLRDAGLSVGLAGYDVDLTTRRFSIIYEKAGAKVLALAQPREFNRTVIRRIYRTLIQSGPYAELHLYSYMPAAELGEFGLLLLEPKIEDALQIDPEKFFLYALTPWPQVHEGER